MTIIGPVWLLPLILSPFIGSFLGVVIDRVENPRRIVFGRSACASCKVRLAPVDLVPIVSFVAFKGRCRHCGAAIGNFHLAIELLAVLVVAWLATVVEDSALFWLGCVLGWTLLALIVIDYRHYVLPDYLTLPLIPLGMLAAWVADPYDGLKGSVIGAAVGLIFIIGLRFFYGVVRKREGIGLGDAKLLAAAGAWVMWDGLPSVILLSALSGIVFAVGRALAMKSHMSGALRIPFGPFLALGLWIVWLYGPLTF
jgi:leader peptidase (prepilin peptidase)/N-methyltransferase